MTTGNFQFIQQSLETNVRTKSHHGEGTAVKKTTFCPFEMDRETDPQYVARGERWCFRNVVSLDYVSVKEKNKIKNCR